MNKDTKVKVAMLNITDLYDYDEYSRYKMLREISDWEEMSAEEAQLLQKGLTKINGRQEGQLMVIYQPVEQHELIVKTIAEGRAIVEQERIAAEKRKAEQSAKIKAREAKQREKSKAKRLEEYERLKAEFEAAKENLGK